MKVLEITDKDVERVIQENKKVVIDCYATWCGPCKMLSPIIDDVAEEYEDVAFFKVDVDNNREIVSKYEIVSIPVLLVFEDGQLKNRSLGLISREEVCDLIN